MSTDTEKKIVLIVDDELEMQVFLSTLLQSEGYTPVVANTFLEGLELAEQLQPVLIILDATLPQQGGAVMYRKLKCDQELCMIPVILISSVDWQTYRHFQKMHSTQIDRELPAPEAFLNKPPEAAALLNIISDLAHSHRA